MCYSYEQSRNNFVINIIACSILYNYKNKPICKILGLTFGYIGLMQLFDMIFWSTQAMNDQSQKTINFITTKIAMVVNHLQPIVIAYIIYFFTGKLGIVSKLSLLLYTFVMSIYTYYAYYNIHYTLVQDVKNVKGQKNKHNEETRQILKWEWTNQPYSLVVYFIFFLTLLIVFYDNLPSPFNLIAAIIFSLTLLFSRHYFKGLYVGRFWCKVVAFLPVLLLLLNFFFKMV